MSDNDLIRRGDAKQCCTDELRNTMQLLSNPPQSSAAWDARNAINAIPAVQPTVKPLRYIEPEGETLDQMRDHARQHPLAQAGDMRLVWVNEGDLHMHTIFHAVQPTVSPDVAALVEALENVIGEYNLFRKYEYERGLAPLDDEIHEARAALARVKGVM